jgi:hypothetical protein
LVCGILAGIVLLFAVQKLWSARGAWTKLLEERTPVLRLLVGFVQVVSRVASTYRLTFPPEVEKFLRSLCFFELDLFQVFQFMPTCYYYSLSYEWSLFCKVGLPLVLFLCIVLLDLSEYVKRDRVEAGGRRLTFSYFIFLLGSFFLFPSFCDSLFTFFDCRKYEDGQTYLVVQPERKCTDAVYEESKPWVVLASFFVPGGILLFIFTELYRHRNELYPSWARRAESIRSKQLLNNPAAQKAVQRGYEDCFGPQLSERNCCQSRQCVKRKRQDTSALVAEVWDERKARLGVRAAHDWVQDTYRQRTTDTNQPMPHHKLFFLYAAYKPRYFWFEAYEMLRKFLLTGLPHLTRLGSDTSSEAAWGTLLMVLALFFSQSINPYKSNVGVLNSGVIAGKLLRKQNRAK